METWSKQVTMKGAAMNLVGEAPKVGAAAPDFQVVGADLKSVKLSSFFGRPILLLSVPSVDTSVCSLETKTFSDRLARFENQLVPIVISMDLPFAQSRWCMVEKASRMKLLSDYKDRDFGHKWGLLIQEVGLLARSAFILDEKGVVQYRHLVKEVTEEPPYDEIIDQLKQLLAAR